MKCKWNAEFEGVCTNGECPYRGEANGTVTHWMPLPEPPKEEER